jgi:hypothetical protein
METPEKIYSDKLADFEKSRNYYHRYCKLFAWLRLIAFLAILLFIYVALSSEDPVFGFILALISAMAMSILIYLNITFSRKRDHYACLVGLCERELKALRHDFFEFPDGKDFIDGSHAFSSDIDLFGIGSAFQYINRTVTHMGKSCLASWLSNPCIDPQEIAARQDACREMATKTDWRLQFEATGLDKELADSPDSLIKWAFLPDLFKNHNNLVRILQGWQLVMLMLTLFVIAGWVQYNLLILLGLINLVIVGVYLKRINEVSHFFGKTYSAMAKYSGLFKWISQSGLNEQWMQSRIRMIGKGETSAASEIGALRRLLQQFDSRNNLLIGFFRNALFLTDLMLVIKMEKWRQKNKENIQKWIDVLGEIDALNGIATFAFNNPEYAYPVPVAGEFSLEARNLGHPLIPAGERICNDFLLSGWHSLVVLTGANMAGKSTFLRTIGINHILAHTGAPVCATEYRFKPALLITSIRTNDSLIKHESYFYAELKKLKSIIDALEQGKEVFILLDEVLKGTNSNDKLNGSIILIKKLLQMQTSGIIATHDISLGELENEFPGNITTSCFEAEISNGQLIFDYKLKQGTAKNMTAIFLMKQMNIV